MHTEEARLNQVSSAHSIEAELLRQSTNRMNHGGVLAMHTPESRSTALLVKANKYNGDNAGQLHTNEAQFLGRVSRWFYYNDRFFNRSDMTIEGYWKSCTRKHLEFLRDNIIILQTDYRWTARHNRLLNYDSSLIL